MLCPRCADRALTETHFQEAFKAAAESLDLESDERKELRRSACLDAVVHVSGGRSLVGSTLDVSDHGAALLVSEAVEVGAAFRVEVGRFSGVAIARSCIPFAGGQRVGFEYLGARITPIITRSPNETA